MKPEETIFEFSSRFRKLMTQAKVSDNSDLAIQSFINAIPRYLTDKLLHLIDSGEINESISEYITRLQIYETSFRNAKRDKEPSAFHYKSKKNNFNPNYKINNMSNNNRNKWCSYHKTKSHDTSDCNKLKDKKNSQDNSNNSNNNNNKSSKHLDYIICIKYNVKGHYPNKCPLNNQNKFNSQIKLLKTNYTSYELLLAPTIINNIKTFALIDSGCDTIVISYKFINDMKLQTEKSSSNLIVAGETQLITERLTKHINIICGNLNQDIQPYIIDMNSKYDLIIGLPYFPKIGIELKGIPFSYVSTADNLANDNDNIEKEINISKEPLTDFQIKLRNELEPIILENSFIPDNAYCPHPAAIINLPTSSDKPFFKRQYLIADTIMPIINNQIKLWSNSGTIKFAPIDTPYNIPLFVIPKKDATGLKTLSRICHDYRPLNNILLPDSFPLPTINEIFTNLSNSIIFTTLDLQSTFHHFPIAENN